MLEAIFEITLVKFLIIVCIVEAIAIIKLYLDIKSKDEVYRLTLNKEESERKQLKLNINSLQKLVDALRDAKNGK